MSVVEDVVVDVVVVVVVAVVSGDISWCGGKGRGPLSL